MPFGRSHQKTIVRCPRDQKAVRPGVRKILLLKNRDSTALDRTIGKPARQKTQGTPQLLQKDVQGKAVPVHLSVRKGGASGQHHHHGAGDPEREGQTENIGTVQEHDNGTELRQIRSVIDTTIKNGMNVLDALSLIPKLQPKVIN